jgi:hypothetical protein
MAAVCGRLREEEAEGMAKVMNVLATQDLGLRLRLWLIPLPLLRLHLLLLPCCKQCHRLLLLLLLLLFRPFLRI